MANAMNVSLIHYHLKAGGVTTVIRHQARLLKDACRLLVISGEPPPPDFPVPVCVVPEIAYGDEGTAETARSAVEKIRALIRTHLSGRCDIFHVHNPLLAKNNVFLDILIRLQDAGMRLLLQIHDFAEDGRPSAYFRTAYPRDCHYAVINSRDYRFLLASGLHAGGLHLLPNVVSGSEPGGGERQRRGPVLYPVRALRRKNLGEAILLSRFLTNDRQVAVTLPPNSDSDMQSYRDWKRFVKEHGYPVIFDIGVGRRFRPLVDASEFLITTSISEGFGFAFLEPWTFGKAVFGRRLAGICDDFEAAGLRLDHLYPQVRVPRSGIDEAAFRKKWRRHLDDACRRYGLPLPETGMDSPVDREWIDFGMLDENAQRQVLRKIDSCASFRNMIRAENPLLVKAGDMECGEETIRHNRDAVNRVYGPSARRKHLLSVYDRVKRCDVRHGIDKQQLVRHFLKPAHFSLLKWSPYAR